MVDSNQHLLVPGTLYPVFKFLKSSGVEMKMNRKEEKKRRRKEGRKEGTNNQGKKGRQED